MDEWSGLKRATSTLTSCGLVLNELTGLNYLGTQHSRQPMRIYRMHVCDVQVGQTQRAMQDQSLDLEEIIVPEAPL